VTFADLLVSLVGFYTPARESMHREWAIETRATYLRTRRPISREDARTIAVFSLSGWAQRYPVQGSDLGEDAALFIAEWLEARALGPSEDAMHGAVEAWQGGAFVGRMRLSIAGF
jgi:hypothetical protein